LALHQLYFWNFEPEPNGDKVAKGGPGGHFSELHFFWSQ